MKRLVFTRLTLAVAVVLVAQAGWAQPVPQAGNDLLQYLPNGNGAIVVDMRKVTSSGVWQTLSSRNPIKNALAGMEGQVSDLGLKLSDIHDVAIALTGSGFNNPVVAASGAFRKDDILAGLRADKRIALSSGSHKNIQIHTVRQVDQAAGKKSTEEVSFAFLQDSTVVVGPVAGVRASIDAHLGQGSRMSQNAELVDGLRSNTTGAARFALKLTPAMTGAAKSNQIPLPDFAAIRMAFGAVDLTSAIDLDVTLRCDTPDNAKAIANQLNSLLGMARGFLGSGSDPRSTAIASALRSVSITELEGDVKITGSLPSELIAQLFR
jgi:hypothetical protein